MSENKTSEINNEYLDALKWRYAAKSLNGETVPDTKIGRILEAVRLAVSSVGLQPYQVFVITEPELKKKLREVANDQQTVEFASHLLVFTTWTVLTETRLSRYQNLLAETRRPVDRWTASVKNREARGPKDFFAWMEAQTYIAFGNAIFAAALEKVDCTPIEGFSPDGVDSVLSLEDLNLRSSLLLPLGFRNASADWASSLPKMRREKDELFTFL